MKEKMIILPGLILVLAGSLVLSGCCTGIGYVVGETLDNHNATSDTILVTNPSILHVGQLVDVRTKDDTVLSGLICGIRNVGLADFPATMCLDIGIGDDTLSVPWNSVGSLALISTRTSSTARVVGIVAGAAIDIAALVITVENLSKTRIGGGGRWSVPW